MRFRFSPFWIWECLRHPPLVYSHPWNSPAAFGQNKRRREELLLLQVSSLEIQLFSSVGRPVTDTGGPIPERVLRDFFGSFLQFVLLLYTCNTISWYVGSLQHQLTEMGFRVIHVYTSLAERLEMAMGRFMIWRLKSGKCLRQMNLEFLKLRTQFWNIAKNEPGLILFWIILALDHLNFRVTFPASAHVTARRLGDSGDCRPCERVLTRWLLTNIWHSKGRKSRWGTRQGQGTLE